MYGKVHEKSASYFVKCSKQFFLIMHNADSGGGKKKINLSLLYNTIHTNHLWYNEIKIIIRFRIIFSLRMQWLVGTKVIYFEKNCVNVRKVIFFHI